MTKVEILYYSLHFTKIRGIYFRSHYRLNTLKTKVSKCQQNGAARLVEILSNLTVLLDFLKQHCVIWFVWFRESFCKHLHSSPWAFDLYVCALSSIKKRLHILHCPLSQFTDLYRYNLHI